MAAAVESNILATADLVGGVSRRVVETAYSSELSRRVRIAVWGRIEGSPLEFWMSDERRELIEDG